MQKSINTAGGDVVSIQLVNQEVIQHFSEQGNFADIIIEQINSGMYSRLLQHKDMIIIDIGANVGLFSLHAQDIASAIYAFEPTPSHFNILTQLTSTFPRIYPINAAITPNDGVVSFFTSQSNSTMNSLIVKKHHFDEIQVRGMNLSTFIESENLNRIDLIKCDIEGGEIGVIDKELINKTKEVVNQWYVEIHCTRRRGQVIIFIEKILFKFKLGRLVHAANNMSTRWNRRIIRNRFLKGGFEVETLSFDSLVATRRQ